MIDSTRSEIVATNGNNRQLNGCIKILNNSTLFSVSVSFPELINQLLLINLNSYKSIKPTLPNCYSRADHLIKIWFRSSN